MQFYGETMNHLDRKGQCTGKRWTTTTNNNHIPDDLCTCVLLCTHNRIFRFFEKTHDLTSDMKDDPSA
jgi:hypothetical protein